VAPGSAHGSAQRKDTVASWDDVEGLIDRLCTTHQAFTTATSAENSISQYEPGGRLLLETGRGTRWVALGDVRACWETFERLGRIRRSDLLEPGRCSAFMFALFAQVEGVEHEPNEELLVLPSVVAR
jgi:hypothetical protein